MNRRSRSREGTKVLLNMLRSRIGLDEATFERYSDFLKGLCDIRHNRIVRSVSMNGSIPLVEKLAFFSRLPDASSLETDEGLRNSLVLIILFDLWSSLPKILSSMRDDYFARSGQVEVLIHSAGVLSEAEQKNVLDRLRDQLGGKSVRPVWSVEPDLKAGLVLRMGTQVWDGSLKGRLARMEMDLLQA
ncbi:F0F1 ATP synthase subunit delta [Leptospirillum ferrooxidans]|uniref:ATP synthase subunit delta n=1 Tax=Leptospirillum ferrooxidans (strain C2-3) TaxID=1162668 RepID=I0IKJ6_LEPFC|nr:F0F1 ATP synthase subunit delta [Leptospirillum ferrooxidans]BAM05795.1 putative ATP synthase F1, delta subunit [Leptospirillum ferrooxidans C2-3]